MSLNLQTIESAGQATIELSGEFLGGEQTRTLDDEFTRLLDGGMKKITLNFKKVWFANSSGIGLLVRLHLRAQKANSQLVIESPGENVLKSIVAMQLDKVLSIETSNPA
ncbi:MAG: STAS domain-containing protein [Chloroherpetonaceae bacterium]|nr:STAS domain-containing protein [Chloroherpetonaceae bacterium]